MIFYPTLLSTKPKFYEGFLLDSLQHQDIRALNIFEMKNHFAAILRNVNKTETVRDQDATIFLKIFSLFTKIRSNDTAKCLKNSIL